MNAIFLLFPHLIARFTLSRSETVPSEFTTNLEEPGFLEEVPNRTRRINRLLTITNLTDHYLLVMFVTVVARKVCFF